MRPRSNVHGLTNFSSSRLAETYHITAKSLTKVSETELAWIAAERALAAAERAEAPLLVGASAYHIGHAFLRAGRNREATALTMDATAALAPTRDDEPERLALWGALHLTGVADLGRLLVIALVALVATEVTR